jgi:YidC/Oxa1 family membrane protein insertase
MKESNKKYLKVGLVALIIYLVFFHFGFIAVWYNVIERPIFNILFAIYGVIGDFGVAIIILTILVRLALWPLVSKQFKQQKKMQAIQPELARIKKKANGNKMLEATLMQELYKEKEISPGGSILTLLIQMPIFIAIFMIIRVFSSDINRITEYTYSFLSEIPRISDLLANPEAFSPHFLGIIDLTHVATQDWVIMILAALAAIFQYIQTSQTMPNKKNKNTLMGMFKSAAKGKEMSQAEIMQQSMGSMTKIFPILTFVIAINFPGALVLYYAVTSLVAIVQQKIILHGLTDDLEDMAENGSKNIKKIKEAEIVKDTAPRKNKNGTTVRRITSDKKGGKT